MDVGNILASLASSGPGFNPSTLPPWMQQHIAANIAAQGGGVPPDMAPQAPPANVIQAAAASPDAPQPAPTPAAPEPSKPEAPQRQRHSLVDTLGRIADTFAALGHAPQNYQAGLDAEDARKQASITHGLERTHAEQEIAQGADEATTRQNALVSQAARRLQAIQQGHGDINAAWPILGAQSGLSPERVTALGQIFAAHPEMVPAFARLANQHADYNGNVVYGRDNAGNLVAYQPSTSDDLPARNILPEGVTPTEPQTVIDTGGTHRIIGRNTGRVSPIIIPNTERPGAAADREQRGAIADAGNQTAITIAGMPARERAAAGQNAHASSPENAIDLLNNIRNGFRELHRVNALPGDDAGVIGNITGALGRTTSLGRIVGEQLAQTGAQGRLNVNKNLSQLQQELIRTLPASATRTRFEQELLRIGLPSPETMSFATANNVMDQMERSYRRAWREAQAETARRAPSGAAPSPARITPRAGGGNIPTMTPAQVRASPSGTRYRTTDGRMGVRP